MRRWPAVGFCLSILHAPSFGNPIPEILTFVEVSVLDVSDCSTTDLVWAPDGSADRLVFRATVVDAGADAPIPDCDLQLDLSGWLDPSGDLGAGVNGVVCGSSSRFATTDSSGAAEFVLTGGGCGVVGLTFVLTGLCGEDPLLLYEGADTFCVKSPDFNGSGNVNFFDTFKFLPQLNLGVGYCCDMAQCSPAEECNFFDTFRYLPHLAAASACEGGHFLLAVVDEGYDPPLDCPLHPEW